MDIILPQCTNEMEDLLTEITHVKKKNTDLKGGWW